LIVHSTRIMGKKTNVEFLNKLYRFANHKYISASPSKDFIKKNLPEISHMKVISSLSGLLELEYNKDEQNSLSKINQNNELKNNIELFKTTLKLR
ncbi:MAG: hypothetical protein GXP61_05905, partial [Epsilonproteobacteria bacterium]|nr:hypothetical protein [Campylobacterota bacterium]